MVVLEAAAITAGGVAAYKGGKAAATSTAKSIKTKLKLSNQEKDRKEIMSSRKEERRERFAKVNEYRTSMRDVNGGSERGPLAPSFNWKKDTKQTSSSRMATSSAATRASRSATASSSRTSSTAGSKFSGKWWEK